MNDPEVINLAAKREGLNEFPPKVGINSMPMDELKSAEVWQIDRHLAKLAIGRAQETQVAIEEVFRDAVQSYLRLPELEGGQSIAVKELGEDYLMSIADSDTLRMVLYASAKARKNVSSVGLFHDSLKAYLSPDEVVESFPDSPLAEVHEFKPNES